MKSNPLLAAIEWVDDVLYGKSSNQYCQWRGAVVPSQNLGKSHMSDLLRSSHVMSEKEREETGKGGFPEPYSLEMNDGTLVSFLLVRGSRRNMREMDTADKALQLSKKMAAYMNSGRGKTHSFGMYFLHDPRTANQVFEQKIAPIMATAKRFGGDASKYVEDLRSRIVRGAAEEMSLFTIRTHPSALRKDEIKASQEKYRAMIAAIMASTKGIKGAALALNSPYGQALYSKSLAILQRHEGLVQTLLRDFNSKTVGINVSLLAVREAFEKVARFADREIPESDWTAKLFGQEGHQMSANAANDFPSPLQLGMQVLTRKIVGHVDANEISQVGRTFYGTAVMEVGPTSPRLDPSSTMFASLMKLVKGASIPMCMSLDIFPDGLSYNRVNQMLNAFLGSVGSQNKQISAAYRELRSYEEKNKTVDPIIGTRMAFSTWASTKAEAEKSLTDLMYTIRGWGGAVPNAETGSPETARLSAIPEFLSGSDAPMMPAPLTDIMYMSPVMRISSPFEHGQKLARTPEGVLYPIGIGTNKQASYVTGVAAPSGSGKSFIINGLHAGLALSPGAVTLPYLCNIDVAPSGKGTLRLLRQILPKSMHHLLVYYKVINNKSACKNPFDLQLGCSAPTPPELDFLTSVFEIVFEGLGDEKDQFIQVMITEAYAMFAAGATTERLWQPALDPALHDELIKTGFDFNPERETTVYNVVDALFAAGKVESAIRAQRFAVPRMEDLSKVIGVERIKSQYEQARVNGEPFLAKASRAIVNAVEQFPLLSGVTRMDLDNARIVVIDLQSVIGGSSKAGVQFAGMMYLYARHLGARNYFLDLEEMRSIVRAPYREYQENRVREIQRTPKILTYDEWHNVKKVKGFVSLNEKETRETRKYKVYVNYITQYVDDFPSAILDGMTTLIVAGQASARQNEFTQKQFDLTETELEVLKDDLDRLGRFWVWFKLRDGQVTALLDNEVGPLEAWCYTTDDKDSPLRSELEELIGERDAIITLAREFPEGTAANELEERAKKMKDSPSGSAGASVTTMLARELAERWRKAKLGKQVIEDLDHLDVDEEEAEAAT